MKFLAWLLALAFSFLLLIPNLQLHSTPTSLRPQDPVRSRQVVAQLHFLHQAIDRGAAQDMQRIYPEGFFFLHTVTGLAWAELALGDSAWRSAALVEARRSLAAIESPEARRIFDSHITPSLGVAYLGWTNFLRGRLLQLEGAQRDSALWRRFQADLDVLAAVYDTASSPFQQSYARMVWPGDNTVPVAAFCLYDQLADTVRYAATVKRWLGQVKQSLGPSGMLAFELEYPSRQVRMPVRGSGQTLLLRFLAVIDPPFAREQYLRMRQTFFTSRLGLPLVREFETDSAGQADYDSGPVIWDIGASATIVSLGTARVFGDTAFAAALEQSINFFGFPYNWRGQRVYALGQMPVADAFLAWSKVAVPQPALVETRSPLLGWWRWPIHLISLLLLAVAWAPWWWRWRWERHAKGI